MEKLKLPEFDPRIEGTNIFCVSRKKWVALTPEEWVRQHFLNLLFEHLSYPVGLTRLEHHHKYFKNDKRSDISILNADGSTFMIVECKAYTERLNQRVVNQVAEYSKVLGAQYLVITNGMTHFVWERGVDEYHQVKKFPDYRQV